MEHYFGCVGKNLATIPEWYGETYECPSSEEGGQWWWLIHPLLKYFDKENPKITLLERNPIDADLIC